MSKLGKIKWIVEHFFTEPDVVMRELKSYWLSNEEHQRVLDGFSENTISNYPLPYGVAPNFVIDDQTYAVPMVTEESSVVAAAASAAKFWMTRGGFTTEIIGTVKCGQVHFYWSGDPSVWTDRIDEIKNILIQESDSVTQKMRARGGGILSIEIKNLTEVEPNYYQIFARFDTCDSMGANFINSVLEQFAQSINKWANQQYPDEALDVVMSILSNYTPECLVKAMVQCPLAELNQDSEHCDPWVHRFCQSVRMANIDPYRATTHNKGIFNGIDAVAIATGNDFRAIEACGHAYAARSGQYSSLSKCTLEDGMFSFWIEIPLAVGTVGGLTKLHPMARRSLELLGNPSAKELMRIMAVTGLAQNFAAVKSLVTTGIQAGHMKLHLANIAESLAHNAAEREAILAHFADKTVSFAGVREFLAEYRATISKIL